MSPLDLSIIIISQNTAQMTARALTSVMTETRRTNYEVIVADLGSLDGQESSIADHPVKPKLIKLAGGISIARATTEASRLAKGKYILLLHADTIVVDNAIDKIVAFAKDNPSARIWGGRTIFQNGHLNPTSCWQSMTIWNLICRATGLTGILPRSELFNGEAYGGWARNNARRVDIITDSFFLIERELWAGLRGFDPVFQNCGQEADLCLRARAFSAHPLFTPSATIIHDGRIGMLESPDRTVSVLNAKATLISRHWRRSLAPLGLFLLAAWPLTRAIATTAAAKITRSGRAKFLSTHWMQVWHRRAEWKSGHAQTETVNPPVAVLAPTAS